MEASDNADEPGRAPQRKLTPLHPNQIWVLRIRGGIAALVLIAAAVAVDFALLREAGVPVGPVPAAALLTGLILLLVLPGRRYRAWGYCEEAEEIHIGRGVWTRVRTAVPFGRVQHIDLAQGPVERAFGVATLILHTAGTRSAAVPLPGLAQAEAEGMRDRIRARIRQDLA